MSALADKIAIITGASSGIGLATAKHLSSLGARLVLAARDADALKRLEQELPGSVAISTDVTKPDQAARLVEETITGFGRVDVLVNNVGGSVGRDHDPFTMTDETFERTLAMNLTSAWWTTSAALGGMRERGWGRIVMIGSGAARASTPGGRLGYTAGKHGLVGLTRQLAEATAVHGITVNCVCPGWTNTSMVDWEAIAARQGVTVAAAQAGALASNAQHRILEPEELTGMISLLVGDEGAGITGQVIGVDGGYGI